MIIATWNINSLKSRLDLVVEWLKINRPTILMLQEIKGNTHIYPKEVFEELGYYSAENLQPTYNGVATLSLKPITVLNTFLPNFEDEQARYLETLIDDIKFINIYAPNGNPLDSDKYTYKLNWLNALYQMLQNLVNKQERFIVAGDFNIIPYEYDVYNPKAFSDDALFQTEVRQLYFKILNLGLTDAIDICYPNKKQRYTWWSYRNFSFEQNRGVRIDHILLCPTTSTRLINCYIDRRFRSKPKPSDHTPVVCNLTDQSIY